MIDPYTYKVLHFNGPFSFLKGEKSLSHSEFVKSQGIYIWTIKDEKFCHYWKYRNLAYQNQVYLSRLENIHYDEVLS